MSRQLLRKQVWAMLCDRPGCTTRSAPAWREQDLPTLAEFQHRGWFIAKTHGDRCPDCVAELGAPDVEPYEFLEPAKDTPRARLAEAIARHQLVARDAREPWAPQQFHDLADHLLSFFETEKVAA